VGAFSSFSNLKIAEAVRQCRTLDAAIAVVLELPPPSKKLKFHLTEKNFSGRMKEITSERD
jgi:hypothetical protein